MTKTILMFIILLSISDFILLFTIEIPPPTSNPKVTQHYEVYLPRLRGNS